MLPPALLISSRLACLLLGASFGASASSDDWPAVDPANLALKASTVEKDADAQALFWEVYLDDLKGVRSRYEEQCTCL